MSRRTDRLSSIIQQELAQLLMREIQDPRLEGIISITRVRVSPDLSVADVFVTVMGSPGQQSAALNGLRHSGGMMRAKLTKSLSLRTAPYLKFHLDENLKKELHVLDLLQQVADENAELDRRRAADAASGDGGDGSEKQDSAQ